MSYKYVEFKINSSEEAKNLPKLVKLAGSAILIEELKENYPKLSKDELALEIKKLHKGKEKEFNKIKSIYEKLWKNVKKDYIKNMEEILDFKIKDKKTGYIVASIWVNIADVLGRKNIFIVAAEKQQRPLDFIMMHELTHLYYTDKLASLNKVEAMKSPLMEGIDHLILFKSPIKKLFKGVRYNELGFVKNNKKFMLELERAWEDRKDFESFLKKAINVQSKYPDVVMW